MSTSADEMLLGIDDKFAVRRPGEEAINIRTSHFFNFSGMSIQYKKLGDALIIFFYANNRDFFAIRRPARAIVALKGSFQNFTNFF